MVQPPLATLPTVLPFSLLWEWNGQARTKDPCDRQTGKQPPEANCSSQSLAVSLSVSLENWKATQLVEQQESPKEECSVMVNGWNGISWRFIITRKNCSVSTSRIWTFAWFKRPMFSFSVPQISGKDHQSLCLLMLRYWLQQMQLGVCLAQMATLAVQSCCNYPRVWKGALQELLAWVLIKSGQRV